MSSIGRMSNVQYPADTIFQQNTEYSVVSIPAFHLHLPVDVWTSNTAVFNENIIVNT